MDVTDREKSDEIDRLCADEGFSDGQKECLRRFAARFIGDSRPPWLTEAEVAHLLYGTMSENGRANARRAIGRLRDRLVSHYGSDLEATLFVEIPRGHYRMEFSRSRPPKYGIRSGRRHKNSIVGRFWEGIIGTQKPAHTYIIFPTEQPAVRDDRRLYTGSGEVTSAYWLAQTLSAFDLDEEICPSHKFDNAQLRRDNRLFVFIGSSLANAALRKLRYSGAWRDKQRYVFIRIDESNRQKLKDDDQRTDWRGAIYDTRARKVHYYESNANYGTEYDYGLIAVSRIDTRCIVAMEGISTIATQVAAEHMLRADGVKEIMKAARLPDKGVIPSFELLFRSEVRSRDNYVEKTLLPYR